MWPTCTTGDNIRNTLVHDVVRTPFVVIRLDVGCGWLDGLVVHILCVLGPLWCRASGNCRTGER